MPVRSDAKVEYVSHGKCVIVGNHQAIGIALNSFTWPSEIERTYVVIGEVPGELERSFKDEAKIKMERADAAVLNGHLGDYELILSRERDGEQSQVPDKVVKSDLILDMMRPPLLTTAVKPFGYFQTGEDPAETRALIASLGDWIGVFEKPRYFRYDEELCAHGYGHLRGCHACIDVCATAAIRSAGDKVTIDPYLCQGCGDCSSACPSGALNFVLPPREQVIEQIRGAMIANEDRVATIVTAGTSSRADEDKSTVEVEAGAVGAFGPELWLAIIAAGAPGVLLSKQGLNPLSIVNLQKQMTWVNELLSGLGFGSRLVAWIEEKSGISVSEHRRRESNGIAPLENKRDVLNLALHRLCQNAPAGGPEVLRLPKSAPLGRIRVDTEDCTLCMTCVNVCPSGALIAGREQPQLGLIENKCVQCGICEEACPEDVIQLEARLLVDREKASTVQVLHQEEVYGCIECGKPFANPKILKTILNKVSGHPLFSTEQQRRRLMMCEDCRVLAMLKED